MADFSGSLNHSIENQLETLKNKFQLNQIEFGKLKTPLSIEFYEKWIAKDYQGSMNYLKDHLPLKKDPRQLNEKINSVISFSQSYFPAVDPSTLNVPARVALYAHNNDYHHWLKEKLRCIIVELEKNYPDHIFLPYVDSGPVLERDMAYQNGLGWFGKNTCLIHPKHGSLFFIAEILTSLNDQDTEGQIKEIELIPDFCGKCQKCIDICPTQALIAPRVLKADQCISYLTIESKSTPPEDLRKKIGDWFFGCDLCQTTCPWNEKVFRVKEITESNETSTATNLALNSEKRHELIEYFKFLLTSSNKKIQKFHFGSPLLRAGAKGLKRNALIVIANQNLNELKTEVENTIKTEELAELAQWTLKQLN